MNPHWLTTLMSKGIELEQNLRQQLQTAKDGLKNQLEERGIRMSAADLAALLEEISPKVSHAALSYALDVVRPFSAGMGLRVSRLSDTHLEMVIPTRTRNLNEDKMMHEGALVTAAIEAAKLLWSRHAPMGNFVITVTKIEFEMHRELLADGRLRIELPEATKEVVLSEVRDHRSSQAEAEVKVFDENEQAVADVRLHLQFKHTPALA
ncbi:hypothetical protein D3C87_1509050 [compost metagenome]